MLRVSNYFITLSISILLSFIFISCDFDKNKEKTFAEVEEINLLLDEEALQSIVDNPWLNNYIPVKVVIKSTGDTISGKLRIRGDSSRGYGKKSFKLKFNQKLKVFNNRKEINLNSAWTDKTFLREYASYLTFNAFDIPVAYTSHIFVQVNGKPYGLYNIIENVDNVFLKLRGLDTKGSLYKAYRDGSCLTYKEDVKKLWRRKNNRKESYKDLYDLIKEINNTPVKDFKKFLKRKFDYEKFITVLAINIVIQNGSTYYHNYFLYHDLWGSGKWIIIPWDLDKTIAYYSWKPYKFYDTVHNNPLIYKSFLNKEVFNDIKEKVFEVVHLFFNEKVLLPKLKERAVQIEKYVRVDTLDKIENIGEWKEYVRRELEFVVKRQENLIDFFSKTLPPFAVVPQKNTCIKPPILRWYPVNYDKKVTYEVILGLEHQLKEKDKTWHLATITDTFFRLPDTLKENNYYWRIIAKSEDGKEIYGLGMSENFNYKKPTVLKRNYSNDTIVFNIENSPYLIKTDVLFSKCKVVFDPGVEVFVDNDKSIIFSECLVLFKGNAKDSITLLPADKSWQLLEFSHSDVNISFLNMVNGKLTYHNSTLNIENSLFEVTNDFLGNNSSMIWGKHGKVHIKNTKLYSVTDSYGEGINLVSTKAIIENNYIENIPDAIELISCDSSFVISNFVKNSGDDGIDFNNCKNVVVKNNYLYKNKDKGISIGSEQYGPTANIISIRNTIYGNKIGIGAKDSSCIKDNNSLFVKNDIVFNAYLKNNYYNFTKGGCIESRNSTFIKNGKLKKVDKFSEIYIESKEDANDNDLIEIKKDWYVFKENKKGSVPFEVKLIRNDSITIVSIKNVFKNPLSLSDFVLFSGDKKISKMPDIKLEAGETLFLTNKIVDEILHYKEKQGNILFKCKKINKINKRPLFLKFSNGKKK